MNSFAGRAQTVINASNTKTVHGSVSFYESDIGALHIIPNPIMRQRTALVLDPKFWCVSYFRNFQKKDLPSNGDNMKKQILVDFTLEAKNEKSSAVIADLTTS